MAVTTLAPATGARVTVARATVLLTLILVTGLGLAIRLGGLEYRDGDLSTDEARLVLASEGILATGLPILPSGRLYTRGLVTAYATAPSLALFGRHDWSARLPGVIVGALLVPAVFLLARAVAGPDPALAAAAVVAVNAPLVAWSRQAWPPMTFLLLFTLAAYAAFRGFVRDEPRWQPLAALAFLAALLAYELALILPLGLGLYLAGRIARRDLGWWRGRPTVAALAIGAAAVGLLAALGLALRAGTLAGADAEFRHYFTPRLGLSGEAFYVRRVWRETLLLLLLVPAGWLWCRLAGRRAPAGLGFLAALLAVALLVPTFVIQSKQEVQYGLAVLPLLAVLGAWGIAALAPGSIRLGVRSASGLLGAVFVVVVLGLALRDDVLAALRPPTPSARPTWLDDLRARGWRPDDLVLAEAPLETQLYLGRADFYVQPEGFERYARQDGPVIRSIYTNAVLLREAGDFERLVAGPHAGRTLWVIGQDDRLPRLTREMDPELWRRLQDAAGVTRPTRGWWLMRIELPR